MPFRPAFDEIYDTVIKDTIIQTGLTPIRADNIFSPGIIIDNIFESIRSSKVVIADITEKNPNVYYELGLAHAMNKTVVLISQNVSDLPFDIQQHRVLEYSNTIIGASNLKIDLARYINNSKNA